jgi:hypothetical protein
MSFQNLVRLSQIKKISLPNSVCPCQQNVKKINQSVSINVIQDDDRLCIMIFTTVLQWGIFHCVKA